MTDDPLSLLSTTRKYLERHPGEAERLAVLEDFLARFPPRVCADREHPSGHITTSGFLVSEAGDAILLIYHLKLQRYLQPGGHVENDDSLLESALREIREEVGIAGDGLRLCQKDEIPIDIDPHRIPARGTMAEHWHFDYRYVFVVSGKAAEAVECQVEEVSQAEWFGWESETVRGFLSDELIARLRASFAFFQTRRSGV